MRPAVFQVGGTLYWVIQTRNPDTMVLKDADSTPSVAVRKNGASVADAVTITKRSATTGIYDCSYNPASEVEGDSFTLEESATVTGTTTSSATYNFNWSVRTVRTGAVELDSGVTDQLDAMEAAIALLRVSESRVVERSLSDTNAITFAWPVSGATITATRSINNGTYGAVQGAIAFLRTESSKHYYTLAFDADDRPSVEGQVRYKLVDGTYTRYVVLRLAPSSGDATAANQVIILDAIDNYISTALAGVEFTPGTITGFPATLNVGDSYTEDCSSTISVFIRDSGGTPITDVGTHSVTDPDFAPECTITQNGTTGRVKATVTYVTASPEGYLKIQIPAKESRRATAGTATVQVLLKWDGAQKTLSTQAVEWIAQI